MTRPPRPPRQPRHSLGSRKAGIDGEIGATDGTAVSGVITRGVATGEIAMVILVDALAVLPVGMVALTPRM
ncbi:MAG: hypothetical protein IPH22_06455 [Nitrosomonas sp.]|nr:hypothetical protein [Nitrosomonas sp.]